MNQDTMTDRLDTPTNRTDLTESPVRFEQPVAVDAAGLTHTGLVRTSNEDHFLISRLGRYFETISTSLPPDDLPRRADDATYSLIVADGMGGHSAGEVASRLAIREIVRLAFELPDWIIRIDDSTRESAAARSQGRIEKLNAMVIEGGQRDPHLRGMGCTLTAARNLGRVLQVVHVGDSRAYLLRAGRLHRLTRDHTYVQMLVDSGLMTEEEAATSRKRHLLVNAVGGSDEDVYVDVERVRLATGDRVLLCSDGLTDAVSDEEIRTLLAGAATAATATEALVARALDAGGRDNITVVVAIYTWEGTVT
jgi:serine/threonine protein phosphatase PrpC